MPLELQFAIVALLAFLTGLVAGCSAKEQGGVVESEPAELRKFNPHLDLTSVCNHEEAEDD